MTEKIKVRLAKYEKQIDQQLIIQSYTLLLLQLVNKNIRNK